MPEFTTDWSGSIDYWLKMFEWLGWVGNEQLHFLELGCFEGRTTLWLLEHVLTHPTSTIVAVDTFTGSPEFTSLDIDRNFYFRFMENIKPYINKVHIVKSRSDEFLTKWFTNQEPSFDFIYVDGSHASRDVLSDAVLAWPLLKNDGVMCFDDYRWGTGAVEETQRPQIAIEAFVQCYAEEIAGSSPQGHDQYVVIKK